MIVYLDESYDHDHNYFMLGALFTPDSKSLHQGISEVKDKYGYLISPTESREIKYSNTKTDNRLACAKDMVDLFIESKSWFRCVVVRNNMVNLDRFGQTYEKDSIKRARMYKKFVELLLRSNTNNLENATLLTDQMTRCKGDEFLARMRDDFSEPGCGHCVDREEPVFKHIDEIDSAQHNYQVIQICDLLLGCVLNEHLEPTGVNKKAKLKRELREYLLRKVGCHTFKEYYWGRLPKWESEKKHYKFTVWYWDPTKGKA